MREGLSYNEGIFLSQYIGIFMFFGDLKVFESF